MQAGPTPISYVRSSRGPPRRTAVTAPPVVEVKTVGESPLASLVRQTSSRRIREGRGEIYPQAQAPMTPLIVVDSAEREVQEEEEEEDWRTDAYAYEPTDAESAYDYNYTLTPTGSERFHDQQQQRYSDYEDDGYGSSMRASKATSSVSAASSYGGGDHARLLADLRIDVPEPGGLGMSRGLGSPLLHSQFSRSRDSLATASESDERSVRSSASGHHRALDAGSFPFQGAGPSSEDGYGDGEDYSSNGVRESWNSMATVRRPEYYMPPQAVVKPLTNFSRPVRESGVLGAAEGERVMPQLPPGMNAAQKREVLERNTTARAPPPFQQEIRPASSVYSDYSYYPYSGAVPSPVPTPKSVGFREEDIKAKEVKSGGGGTRTPQDYLQLGIQHHEANRLEESARCFERSATEGGGCGVGMLMYGLTLRHGWGCGKKEKLGFKWLMKAAECAVGDLERMRRNGGDGDAGVVETELVLAIYEVGQCFFHGWGVPKDQKMAVSYYTVAAKLGDGDAQADLAYCLANAKGTKKDMKEAARWYRRAVEQGQSDVGLDNDILLQKQTYLALEPVWRMLNDVLAIPGLPPRLAALVALDLAASLVPALHVSYSGRLLDIVQTAVDTRTVDHNRLVTVIIALFLASLATRFLTDIRERVSKPVGRRIKAYYSIHIFDAFSRLDVPTFDDPAVQAQLQQAFPPSSTSSIAYNALSAILQVATTTIQLVSQFSVLLAVLQNQPDGPLLSVLCFLVAFVQQKSESQPGITGVWLGRTTDADYIKSEGLKRAVNDPIHRKEIVAAGISSFLLAQYRDALSRIADRAGGFFEMFSDEFTSRKSPWYTVLFQEFLRSLPEIVFTIRAVQHPASIPLSLASLHLIRATSQSFAHSAVFLTQDSGDIRNRLAAVQQLYQVSNIPNLIKEGPTPFPENDKTLAHGISVEFQNVYFEYPDSEAYALHNVSFKIERGQLCVIVGNNGSGKSTILKLIARLYDPTSGDIFIDGVDIKTLRLDDLHRAISVLFQDYTHFPLSIRDNIAIGDPLHASDQSKIERAAQLAGADTFIEKLPAGYETYIDRPVQDYYSVIPEGARRRDGREVGFERVRWEAGLGDGEEGGGMGGGRKGLSGGQMQRIALARTFMRSVVSDESVGLLLFDEPSASLDPRAEHDLFERLRMLRGRKTMVFSSHRFGNLTRHADLILYMDDSVVVEEGTHEQLVGRGGEYARIWNLQAQAFL